MKVGINARLLVSGQIRGWSRYTTSLAVGLVEAGVDVYLYLDGAIDESHLVGSLDNCTLRVSPRMRYASWEHIWLPRQCKADALDLFHCPFHFGLPWRSPCPTVLTLHDAIDHAYPRPGLKQMQLLSRRHLLGSFYAWTARTRADHIITVSEHARSDIERLLHVAPGRMSVIHEAASSSLTRLAPAERRADVRKRLALGRPYIFYVGGWERRKNIGFLLKAFADAGLSGVDLVLAGGNDLERRRIEMDAATLGIASSVKTLAYVLDADLPSLYGEAQCFVYPSEYEGFGLQVCEAMAAGCPVLVARASSLPEIVGTGGLTFGLQDTSELAALLRRVATEPGFCRALGERSRARSNDFSWSLTAARTIGVYTSLIEERIRSRRMVNKCK